MTALLNFGKNFGLSIAAFVVLNVMLLIWLISLPIAAVFHGVNRITGRAKR